MSILCLDVGDKNIGLALSDSLGIVASGIGQLRRVGPKRNKELEDIKKLISQHQVDRLVVGLPISMNGEEGDQARKVRNFVHELSSGVGVPVVLFDERLSTVEAERVLREAKASPRKRRQVRDKIAATVILQNYLDSQVR